MKSVDDTPRRAHLLELAAHICATEGAAALTVRRLAHELGTSTMSLYSDFGSKEALFQATADEFVVRFADALRAVPVTDSPLYDFICLAHRYRSSSLENRDLYRVAMVSGRLSLAADTPRGIQGMFDYCAGALARCITAKAVAIADPKLGLMAFWTAVHGQVLLETEQVFASPSAGFRAWEKCFRVLLLGHGAKAEAVDEALLAARQSAKAHARKQASAGSPRRSFHAASGKTRSPGVRRA